MNIFIHQNLMATK